jgi:hypothetical protein
MAGTAGNGQETLLFKRRKAGQHGGDDLTAIQRVQ